MAFEQKDQKLIPFTDFLFRILKHVMIAGGVVSLSILIGTLGYHFFENLSRIDSFYNASMILSGMGPVTVLKKSTSKIFASLFAIYGGIVILAITGIILAPLAHRLLHIFHLNESDD